MVCSLCHVRTNASLCQVCQYLAEQVSPAHLLCRHCRAPIAQPSGSGRLCRLCRDLLQVVRAHPWLCAAQAEWERENFTLARRKRELMG